MFDLTLAGLREKIPVYVTDTAKALGAEGYDAYLVGGSMRDLLTGKIPDDFDIATNAYPEEIQRIFPKSIPTGAAFGTITVVGEDENGESFDMEVTTYRSEADYMGGRWPAKVEFTKTIEEDLARRDFTINAMALDLTVLERLHSDTQVYSHIVDPYGGIDDLRQGVIRAVGDPIERFSEDGLRPMRACRLASQLEFAIEEGTFHAIKGANHVTKMVSAERQRDELMKLLLKSPKPSYGLRLMADSGIMDIVIPELMAARGVTQPEYHVDDVFDHTLKTVDEAEDSVKLGALFHDIAKPATEMHDDSGTHFYGHDVRGAEMAGEIMRRLKFPNAEIDRVQRLVRWHMFFYPSADWRKDKARHFDFAKATKTEIQEQIDSSQTKRAQAGWSDSAIRRLIANVGGEEAIDDLFKLRIADAAANPKSEFNPEEIAVLAERVASVRAEESAMRLSDLDITGHDLISELGVEAGPILGEILQYLLEEVLDEPIYNRKEKLLELARNWLALHEREQE